MNKKQKESIEYIKKLIPSALLCIILIIVNENKVFWLFHNQPKTYELGYLIGIITIVIAYEILIHIPKKETK